MNGFLVGFRDGFRQFGENVGLIVNSFLLTFVYFFGVGSTFFVAKLLKKRFLETKTDKKTKTYWSTLDLEKRQIEEDYRQF